ncbi:hypothetical protein KKA47_00885 [bacterium]|nr:hypothetical protein [bacterium]
MLRYIIIGVMIYFVFKFWKRTKHSLSYLRNLEMNQRNAKQNVVVSSELVKCAGCDLYVPSDSMIEYRGNFYCSKECKSKA